MIKELLIRKKLNSELYKILGFEIGYEFQVSKPSLEEVEAESKKLKDGLSLSEYSHYNFYKFYEYVEEYINGHLEPRADLYNKAVKYICNHARVDENFAKEYVKKLHYKFIDDVWAMLKSAKPCSVKAKKVGNCYFSTRLLEDDKKHFGQLEQQFDY